MQQRAAAGAGRQLEAWLRYSELAGGHRGQERERESGKHASYVMIIREYRGRLFPALHAWIGRHKAEKEEGLGATGLGP